MSYIGRHGSLKFLIVNFFLDLVSNAIDSVQSDTVLIDIPGVVPI
jgi:hypothetical protein